MYLTYEDYTDLGYGAVSAIEFPRYAAMAENSIRRIIQNRPFIRETDAPDSYNLNDPDHWAEQNRRGICELINIKYAEQEPNGDYAKSKRTINSWSNAKYSENYGSPRYEPTNSQGATADPVMEITGMYFTPDQLWRGIG